MKNGSQTLCTKKNECFFLLHYMIGVKLRKCFFLKVVPFLSFCLQDFWQSKAEAGKIGSRQKSIHIFYCSIYRVSHKNSPLLLYPKGELIAIQTYFFKCFGGSLWLWCWKIKKKKHDIEKNFKCRLTSCTASILSSHINDIHYEVNWSWSNWIRSSGRHF